MNYNYLNSNLTKLHKMNNLKEERERIKIQKLLYKQNKLIREQKEKESINNTPVVIPTKTKKKLDIPSSKGQFSSIPIERLNDNSTTEDVSLTDMLGIKSTDAILNNAIASNSNGENEKAKLEENDRHYAPDFI